MADQRLFDLLFGILAPVVCVLIDPAVFSSGGIMGGVGFLGEIHIFGYAAIVVGQLALGYYLLTCRSSPLLAGILWGACIFASGLGILLIPLSLIGLIMVIGILGFTPFLTGLVFARNARRCWHESSIQKSRKGRLFQLVVGMVLFLGTPAGLQITTDHVTRDALQAIQTGSEDEFTSALETFRQARFLISPDKIALAYQRTEEIAARDRLSRAYTEITGKDITTRLAILQD